MKCSVCENEIGLWARLTSNAGVCRDCREQANSQIQVLLLSVTRAQSFNLQFAQGWVSQFDETTRKYQMPEKTVGPLRFSLLNIIFKLIEAEEEMPEADRKFLLSLAQKYELARSVTPELQDTIVRIGMKEAIQLWEEGEIPRRQCNGLVLQKGEVCQWEESAGLRVQRTKREYVGGFSSISVPIPLISGARFRVGGFKGHPIDSTAVESGGSGVLHITNQRLCFAGQQRAVSIPYKKMISMAGFEGGFIVQTSNEKKPGIFVVRHPELTTHMIALASSPPEKETPQRQRQTKLTPTE